MTEEEKEEKKKKEEEKNERQVNLIKALKDQEKYIKIKFQNIKKKIKKMK